MDGDWRKGRTDVRMEREGSFDSPWGLAQDDRGEAGADSPGVDDEGEPVMPPTNGRRYGQMSPYTGKVDGSPGQRS